MPSFKKNRQRGNILIAILVAIVVVAMLTMAVSQYSEQQSDSVTRQTQDDQISRTLTQASTLGSAVHQMLVNGEDPATLYTNLSQLKPGDTGFETAPNNFKIYHPLGGGVSYMAASSPQASAIATAFNINAASIIKGVGPTDVTVGDIVFTAKIASASACQRINKILNGSTTVPVLTTSTFDALFTAGTTVTVDSSNCASCVNVPRLCVSNTAANAWGFYSVLLPG